MAQKYPGINDPVAEVESLRTSVAQVKEGFEILTQQRGTRAYSAVTWQDLLNLGLITPGQMPVQPTSK